MKTISFIINGEKETKTVHSSRRLLEFLRDDLNLTGTKEGCGEGECGACTVILNKKAVHSCMMLAAEIDGAVVETIEGLSDNGRLHTIQKKFIEHGAVQCGFCTPGMIMSAKALLDKNPNPDEEEIKDAISGNLCRCTGYKQIIDAIKAASAGGAV